jgi:hypothetical protein
MKALVMMSSLFTAALSPTFVSAGLLIWAATATAAETTAPNIATLLPASGPLGTLVTVQGTGFTPDNLIRFRSAQDSFDVVSIPSENGTTVQFRVTTCPSYQPQCPARYITPGVYEVTLINANGESNRATFVLTRR